MSIVLLTVAAVLTLLPFAAAAFFPTWFVERTRRTSAIARYLAPTLLCVPYLLVGLSEGIFRWRWLGVYATVPVAIALLLDRAREQDRTQRGTWIDFLVLLVMGLAVDLRWFEHAWPAHLISFNKVLLLDAGIYGFAVMRRLDGVGLDLRLRLRDLQTGLQQWALYTPIAVLLGLHLGFLHVHRHGSLTQLPPALLLTFFLIAVPEELFFRGWLQNLLERRVGRSSALFLTAVLFGLAHFNKRALHFNWRYVLLAMIAGLFYGRAWRHEQRIAASAITHACVDAVWSVWLR